MQDVNEIASSIASHLGEIEGVAAVALSGAWARGVANLEADIDLSIFYYDHQRPSVDAMRALALELNSFLSAETVTDFWQQGPLLNGGAWLWVEGRRVNWQYRDVERVRSALDQAKAGGSTAYYQVGHPHGFFSHYYLGEVAHCRPLYDPDHVLRSLKRNTHPYPPSLKRSLATTFIREADLTLYAAQQALSQGDVFYATGCVYRCIACLVQVLHAVNEEYLMNERQGIASVMRLDERPDDFESVVTGVVNGLGTTLATRLENINQLRGLVQTIQVEHVNLLESG